MATYNNAWEITLSYNDDSWKTLDSTETSPIVGNGKLAIYPSFDIINGAKNVYITRRPRYDANTNAVQTFNPFKVWIGSETAPVEQSKQTLNMLTGIFTSYAKVTGICDVETDVYAPRHLPFSSVKTVRITPLVNLSELEIHHEISWTNDYDVPSYTNSVVYDDLNNVGIPMISCVDPSRQMYMNSVYIIDPSVDYVNKGFNIFQNSKCFNKILLRGLVAGQTYRIHIVNVHMSVDDYTDAGAESKKIALNCVNKGIDNIRAIHIRSWAQLWKTDISIIGKSGITSGDEAKLNTLKRHIKMSMYKLFSASRETVYIGGIENYGMIDITGNLLMIGDLFAIPSLLLLRPNLARSLLDYRYTTLPLAKQLAAGYGFRGAKYPYQTEQTGYKNSLYWNTQSNLTFFNTALISINIWNYFRRTKDKEWLKEIGYPVLKENANFFVDNISGIDEATVESCRSTTVYDLNLNNVVSLNGFESEKNNAFTNNLVRLALKAAIEDSYELAYGVPDDWKVGRNWLPVPISLDGSNIYHYDANITYGDSNVVIAEPWMNLVPYYVNNNITANQNASILFTGTVGVKDILANLNAHRATSDDTNVLNIALEATLTALYMQTDVSFVGTFETLVNKFIDEAFSSTVWKINKDVTVDALFLFIFIQGLSQLNIKGGVAETRFYYDEMKLAHVISAAMPAYWKEIKITTDTNDKFITTNVLTYP